MNNQALSPAISHIEKLLNIQEDAINKINQGLALIYEALAILPQQRIELKHNIYFYHCANDLPRLKAHAKKDIDKQLWEALMDFTEFRKFLTSKQKQAFSEAVRGTAHNSKPQPFSKDVALSTFADLIENRDKNIKKGFIDIFTRLSREYKSHSKFKVKKRIIVHVDGWYNYVSEALKDFDKFWLYLQNVDLLTVDEDDLPFSIAYGRGHNKIDYIADGYEYRFFENGNCHLIIHDKDMLDKINMIIADYFDNQIANER